MKLTIINIHDAQGMFAILDRENTHKKGPSPHYVSIGFDKADNSEAKHEKEKYYAPAVFKTHEEAAAFLNGVRLPKDVAKYIRRKYLIVCLHDTHLFYEDWQQAILVDMEMESKAVPLTYEELLAMDRKPVWVTVPKYNWSGWGIVSVSEFDRIVCIVGTDYDKTKGNPLYVYIDGRYNDRFGALMYREEQPKN